MNKLDWRLLQDFMEAWLTAELPTKPVAPLKKIQERRAALKAEFRPIASGTRADTKQIAQRLADGEITARDSVIEHFAASAGIAGVSQSNSMPRYRVLFDEAEAVLRRQAEAVLATADLCGVLVAEMEKKQKLHASLTPLFTDPKNPTHQIIHTAEQAIATGRQDVAQGWNTKLELEERGRKQAAAYNALARLGYVPLKEKQPA